MVNSDPPSNATTDLEAYNQDFYLKHTERKSYRVLGKLLFDLFRPRSAIDFGCGIGGTLHQLSLVGVEVLGLEGSSHSVPFAKIDIQVTDLSQPIDLHRCFDLALSTEVAEHLPAPYADQFVANIARHANGNVFFTAAMPGQSGTGHVNCRPKAYWAGKFLTAGYRKARIAESVSRIGLTPLIWEMPWILHNMQIFTKTPMKLNIRALLLAPAFFARAGYWRFRISRLGGREFRYPGGR